MYSGCFRGSRKTHEGDEFREMVGRRQAEHVGSLDQCEDASFYSGWKGDGGGWEW